MNLTHDLTLLHFALAWVGAFAAGWMDSMAGGGGLIILPLLLALGIPPHMALGTNKLQGSFGTLTASFNFIRKGLLNWRSMLPAVGATLMGALAGSLLANYISPGFLSYLIPVLLTLFFLYSLFSSNLGEKEGRAKVPELGFMICAGILLGFYDGFFGPGTGSFWTLGLILLLGRDFRRATAETKIVNFTSNITALAIFLFMGQVHILLGLSMGLFQIAGAWVGSHIVMKGPIKVIRWVFLGVIALTLVKLYWNLFI